MGIAVGYREKIINLTKELPEDKLKELIDFAQFLKAKKEAFTFTEVKDSAEYIKRLRVKEGRRVKSGENFIEELIEWQKSNS